MCVFLFSNEYIEKTFLCCLDYLLNKNIKKVILLKENHAPSDVFICTNMEIELCDKLENGIVNSDFVLILQNGQLPVKKIDYVQRITSSLNKKCYLMDSVNLICKKDFIGMDTNANRLLPIISVASFGYMTQHYCIEVLLRKIFLQLGISCKQIYANDTYSFLRFLEECNLLNPLILKDNNCSPQLIVNYIGDISMENSYDCIKLESYFINQKPDFMILCIDALVSNIDELKNSFRIKFGKDIDLMVQSQFTGIKIWNDKVDFLYKIPLEKSIESVNMLFDSNLENIIYQKIMHRLSIPENVKII